MKNLKHKWICLFAVALIPLDQPQLWHHFKFTSISSNQVQFGVDGLNIDVDQSASPLIYRFDAPTPVNGIHVKARFSGEIPRFSEGQIQGQENSDDFVLRFGLIIKGNSRLNWFQRQLAPSWLIKMEKLLPSSMGIKEVQFFTTCQQRSLLNQTRKHILDSSLIEKCVVLLDKIKDFEMVQKFQEPKEVIGLWVGADGDQTKAKFALKITEIKINYK